MILSVLIFRTQNGNCNFLIVERVKPIHQGKAEQFFYLIAFVVFNLVVEILCQIESSVK